MQNYYSRVGVTTNLINDSIDPNPFPTEDAHANILAGLADEPAYDLIQLDPLHDPDLVGLVVDGRLRATYRKVDVYTATSMVARTILDRSAAQAFQANTLVRNFNRAARGSVDPAAKGRVGELSHSLESESSSWTPSEFTTPPLSDGSESAHGQESNEGATEPFEVIDVPPAEEQPVFDMGPATKLLDDDELDGSLPGFFDKVTGVARKHEPTDEENGW